MQLIKKYGIYFLILIVISKISYLILEVYYNGYLIDTVTSSTITLQTMEKLEELGHNVSSLGFSLLLLPFTYLLIKKYTTKRFMLISINLIGFIAMFFFFKILLTETMNYIVKENSDKRFSSYYISVFKYGILNNTMGYESFIPKERVENLSIEDKVILSNIFILNYVDEKLIDKLLNDGVNSVIDTIIKKYDFDRYLSEKQNIESKSLEIINAYNQYVEATKTIKSKLKEYDNQDRLFVEYQDFQNQLHFKYSQYKKNSQKALEKAHLSDRELNNYYNDLTRYFRYKGHERAETRYRNNMYSNFGHYIEPTRWCNQNSCPSKYAIQKTVRDEVYESFSQKSGGVLPGLDERSFFKNTKIKKSVIKLLREKGLPVKDTFNYSYNDFKHAYQNKLLNEKKNSLKELSKKFGINLKYGLSYNKFVSLYYNDVKKSFGKEYAKHIIDMFIEKDTTSFYEKVYKPKYKSSILKDYLLTKEDFLKKENFEKGDNAIKMLYITPFAVNISLLSALLNLISLIALLVFIIFKIENKYLQISLKGILLSIAIIYPIYISNTESVLNNYQILNNNSLEYENEFLSNYSYFLKWILPIEKFSYENLYTNYLKSNQIFKIIR